MVYVEKYYSAGISTAVYAIIQFVLFKYKNMLVLQAISPIKTTMRYHLTHV